MYSEILTMVVGTAIVWFALKMSGDLSERPFLQRHVIAITGAAGVAIALVSLASPFPEPDILTAVAIGAAIFVVARLRLAALTRVAAGTAITVVFLASSLHGYYGARRSIELDRNLARGFAMEATHAGSSRGSVDRVFQQVSSPNIEVPQVRFEVFDHDAKVRAQPIFHEGKLDGGKVVMTVELDSKKERAAAARAAADAQAAAEAEAKAAAERATAERAATERAFVEAEAASNRAAESDRRMRERQQREHENPEKVDHGDHEHLGETDHVEHQPS